MSAHKLAVIFLLCSGLFSIAEGHHNNRPLYNQEQVIQIQGRVTEVWYVNPHTRLYLMVTDNEGNEKLWEAEARDRGQLDRSGWKYNLIVEGDEVVVTGRPARDGGPRLQLLTILRPSDGWAGIGYTS